MNNFLIGNCGSLLDKVRLSGVSYSDINTDGSIKLGEKLKILDSSITFGINFDNIWTINLLLLHAA